MKSLNTLFVLCLCFKISFSQNTIGFPDVINYAWQDYKSGLQNWDIKQASSGMMYFANNEGLLTFDGVYWDLYALPHKTIARSIEIDKKGRIYIGGQDELGYFQAEKSGKLVFHDLTNIIPAQHRTFGDVWDIISTGDDVYFRTNDKIFRFTNNTFTVYKAPAEWNNIFVFKNRFYAQDQLSGLLMLSNELWANCETFNEIAGKSCIITGTNIQNNRLIISTLKNGLYAFDGINTTPITSTDLVTIQNQRIYSLTKANDRQLCIGTSTGGIYVIDEHANLIQKFSIKEGLQNNNILSSYVDTKGNIWLGLDNGIDCIAYNNPIKHIIADEQDASGYTALIKDSKLFIGTSSGLYQTELQNNTDISFSKGAFHPITNSSGQVWGLADVQGHLMMGHHEGLFEIENNNAKQLISGEGCWNMMQLTGSATEEKYVGGFYKGIRFFNLKDGQIISDQALPRFLESSRYLTTDAEGNIWVSHPYHGVYLIIKDPSNSQYKVEKMGAPNGLPGTLNNFVFKVKNQIVAATEKGVYSFNKNNRQFAADSFYNRILGNQSIRYLKEDLEGNIWFIHEKKLGVIDNSGNSSRLLYISDLDNRMLSGFEYIYPVNASNILLGGEKGFYHINYKKYKSYNTQPGIRLHKVKIFNTKDSTVYGGFMNSTEGQDQVSFDYDWRNLHFEFSSPDFGSKSKTQFSYCLQGYDYGWSEWLDKTEKDYTNLPPGKYVFQVKSRNSLGIESKIETYTFVIHAPWYRTLWAYSLYFLLGATLLGAFYMKQRRKLRKQRERHLEEQHKTNYLHQLEKDKAESELLNLRNDKLQSEVDFKNAELANTAMHLLQKGELIAKLKGELTSMMKKVKDEQAMTEIKKMIRALSDDEHIDEDWEHFAQHFDKVHSDFTQVLMSIHNNITPNDVKLCTYLRMNLSSKEISRLMNISVRGVELSRYRLRKKMGLSTETNLVDYLMKLGQKKSGSNDEPPSQSVA